LINRFGSIKGVSPDPSHPESPGFLSYRQIDCYLADKDSPVPPFSLPDLGKFLVGRICLHETNDASEAGKLAKHSSLLDSERLPDNKTTKSATPNTSSAANTTINATEKQEGLEIVDPDSFYKQDVQALFNDMSALDIKSDETKVFEPLDTRTIPIKPYNGI
jgi:hypothetical protein